jgi:DNA-binding GntR family transcriptional regulator
MPMTSTPGWAPPGTLRFGWTKAEVAYHEIRSRIMDGSLPPGSVIDQDRYAGELSLSVTPVREALRRLEAEHLVRQHAHREVRVAPFSADELRHLYAVRLQLDPFAAGLAAKEATQAELEAVAALLQAPAHGEPREMLTENRKLHRLIYASCHNPVLIQMLDSLWDRCDRYRLALLHTGDADVDAARDHTAIMEAFCRRDSRTLRRLMTNHLKASLGQVDHVTFD